MIRISVCADNFAPGDVLHELEQLGGGAVASFTGLVRGDDDLVTLQLDHYPAMSEKILQHIAARATARWSLTGLILIHRIGILCPGERIVFVGTASKHRAAALDACHFLIDWLKTDAPFWKKESFADGRTHWVEERQSDKISTAHWLE